ncbi:hypothetical protein [Haloferax larsenii]|uniref:Uncharacterized protein n=1 Tax=Haloferax larsenii TaxID=302484 RepID=A0A1H7N698_HALLR|nr:hypothetical protein [Haloferax larsenii]SEL18407.1 hypothetical protein SAMN04488691_103189 [Haloferax larsenii]
MFDYDPNHNDSTVYDDRDELEPEFLIDEQLAFGLGIEERDPAEDPLAF